jgi:hypothetical protein
VTLKYYNKAKSICQVFFEKKFKNFQQEFSARHFIQKNVAKT